MGLAVMGWLILIALDVWAIFGSSVTTTANWIWPGSPAPWETIDAFYYPNKRDLTVSTSSSVASIAECRSWAHSFASGNGDPDMTRGTYQCGVGYLEKFGTSNVYRLTLK